MDSPEWESVLQFVSEPLDMGIMSDKPIHETSSATPSQVPTPPSSNSGSPPAFDPELNPVVSISTTFFSGANLNTLPPDLVFLSSDAVFFYVHSEQVLGASENGFCGLLPAKQADPPPALKSFPRVEELGPIIALPESAHVVNVVLHTIYGISCAHYAPALDVLLAALDALHEYGIPLKRYCTPSTPLFSLILAQAPYNPIEVYALAARHDLYDLAVPISSHLLGYQLANLSDELVQKMGPVYLKRLFFLHLGRIDALKRLLLPPPHPHAPTADCDFTEQKKLTRAWALASAYLAWDARPDLSMAAIEAALRSLEEHLSCGVCKKALGERIKQLIVQWSVVKRTI